MTRARDVQAAHLRLQGRGADPSFVSILWIGVAERYNEALVAVAAPLLYGELTVTALGSHLLIEEPGAFQPLSIDGLTLHFGLVLMAVLVLAAVGVSAASRIRWLALMVAGSFLLHVVGVVLLARGVAWSLGTESPDESGSVSNQQEWDTLGPERSSVRWRPGELPEGLVVTSASLDRLGLHLLPSG